MRYPHVNVTPTGPVFPCSFRKTRRTRLQLIPKHWFIRREAAALGMAKPGPDPIPLVSLREGTRKSDYCPYARTSHTHWREFPKMVLGPKLLSAPTPVWHVESRVQPSLASVACCVGCLQLDYSGSCSLLSRPMELAESPCLAWCDRHYDRWFCEIDEVVALRPLIKRPFD